MDEFKFSGVLWRTLFALALGFGMWWAHIRRRVSGQASLDEVN